MKQSTYILLIVTLTLALPLGAQVSTATDDPGAEVTSRSFALSTGSRMGAPRDAGELVLVIPAGGMSTETLAELRKDMHIMCQIFDRRLEEANLRPAGRPRMFAPNDRRTTRGVYLPGFGPVFLLEADFPLLSGPEKEEPPVEESGDALWLEVKQQMEGKPVPNASGRAAPEYDEMKVEKLRSTLTTAMKHAANFRHLEPNDRIVVIAVNSSNAAAGAGHVMFGGAYGQSTPILPTTGPTALQVLALQATKANVDAYAEARLTDDQFREEADIATYELPPAGGSSGTNRTTVPRSRTPR